MKISMADEEGICESRRRVYCDICTKGNVFRIIHRHLHTGQLSCHFFLTSELGTWGWIFGP